MKKTNTAVEIACTAVLGVCLAAVSLYGIFRTDKPTVSVDENRTLAAFPPFSVTSLANGSYFSGINSYLTDTFPAREHLLKLSKSIEQLYGIAATGSMVDIVQANNREYTDDTAEIDFNRLPIPSAAGKQQPKTPPKSVDTDTVSTGTAEIHPDTTEPVGYDETTVPVEPDETIEPAETDETIEPAETDETIEPAETDESVDTEKADEAVETDSFRLYIRPSACTVAVGSKTVISAYTDSDEGHVMEWHSNNRDVASIGFSGDDTVIEANSIGTAEISVKCEHSQAVCRVTVVEAGSITVTETDEPEFITGGLIIYDGAVYTIPYLGQNAVKNYAGTVDYIASLFNVPTTVLTVPLSSGMLDIDTFGSRLTDQNAMIDTINSYMNTAVGINCYALLYEHRDEYLYFRSDHHWTQLGAYYGYKAFVESVGLTAAPLESFTIQTIRQNYHGSMNTYSGNDPKVAAISDTIDGYLSQKPHTMTVTASYGSAAYDNSILTERGGYMSFIGGDNPYTVINVPENPQDCNILVFKDSYGNALVPFLVENYGNIIVVDPRYFTDNIYELLQDYPLRDILICNQIYNPSVASWYTGLLGTVGIYLE